MSATKLIENALVFIIKTLLRFGEHIWLVQSQLTKFTQNLRQVWKPNRSEAAAQPNTKKTGLWMSDCVTVNNHLNILSIWCKQRIRLFCCHSHAMFEQFERWKQHLKETKFYATFMRHQKSIYKIVKWIWALWFLCVCLILLIRLIHFKFKAKMKENQKERKRCLQKLKLHECSKWIKKLNKRWWNEFQCRTSNWIITKFQSNT